MPPAPPVTLASSAARRRYRKPARVLQDPVLIPLALAPLVDPNVHSCGTVYPHGVRELSHPEPGVYLVGMKSYGRAPTFLAMTGYEQVRSIAAAIAGDTESSALVELSLPDTGVCGGSGEFDPDGSSAADSCAPAAELLTIGRPGTAALATLASTTGCAGVGTTSVR